MKHLAMILLTVCMLCFGSAQAAEHSMVSNIFALDTRFHLGHSALSNVLKLDTRPRLGHSLVSSVFTLDTRPRPGHSALSNTFTLDTRSPLGHSLVSNVFTLDTRPRPGHSALSNTFTLDTRSPLGHSLVSNVFTLDTRPRPGHSALSNTFTLDTRSPLGHSLVSNVFALDTRPRPGHSALSNTFTLDTRSPLGHSLVSNIFTLDTYNRLGHSALSIVFTLNTRIILGHSLLSNVFTLDTFDRSTAQNVTEEASMERFGTSLNRNTGQFSMLCTWTNTGVDTYSRTLQMVIENITPDTITCVNADGITTDGKPYYDFSSLVGDGKLEPEETSKARMIVFSNPGRAGFEFDISCWAVVNNGGLAAPSKQEPVLIHVIIPGASALAQNYPNPFNPETWLPYELADAGHVSISIYDIQGKTVRTLDLGHREIGRYFTKTEAAYWDGKNESGEQVSSGVYFYTIQAGGYKATRKMVIAP